MLSLEEHLDNLTRHIDLTRDACVLLGKRLIKKGQQEFGRILIARGFSHDYSKFFGIEWEYLHAGEDVPEAELHMAIKQHTAVNDHHPEYWGGIENMPDVALAEMICDWYARSQEFGTSIREWYQEEAMAKFKISKDSYVDGKINEYLDILLQNTFKKPATINTTVANIFSSEGTA